MFDAPANDLTAAATVRKPVTIEGVGLHTGAKVSMVIEPASVGEGVRFVRADLDGPALQRTVDADPALVTKTQLGTVLTNGYGTSISTVEHLMAAFAMRGVTEARVQVSGPEVPILDGSALDFITALDDVGLQVFPQTVEPVVLREAITVTHDDSWITCEPLPEGSLADLIVDVTIAFDHQAIGTQHLRIEGNRDSVLHEVADARTFTELRHVEALRAMGLARGGSLDNAIVLGPDGILNPEGLRREREFVRHKTLDLIGDLYLLGQPLGCKITAHKPGHTINTMLASALSEAVRGDAAAPLSIFA